MMDPDEVLRRILEHDQAQETPRDFDAEVVLLRQIEALRAKEHKFTPGQIIRHRYPKQAAIRHADAPSFTGRLRYSHPKLIQSN